MLATALFSMFALSTFLWASKLAIFMQRFHIAFIRTEGSLLSRLTIADADTEKMRYMDDIMFIVLVRDSISPSPFVLTQVYSISSAMPLWWLVQPCRISESHPRYSH